MFGRIIQIRGNGKNAFCYKHWFKGKSKFGVLDKVKQLERYPVTKYFNFLCF